MLVLLTLLPLLVKVCGCRTSNLHALELFRLLQTEGDLLPDPTMHDSDCRTKASRRPVPSDHLPVDDLLENDSKIYDPLPGDINDTLLRLQMGKDFDPNYMSVRNPKNDIDEAHLIAFVNGRPKGRRPSFLRLLRSARLQDGRKWKLDVDKRERRKFQKYIWSLTFCPVIPVWKKLGIRFWPQWIRKGTCTSKRSCSVPEGMTCKASASTYKTFLRWHCEDFAKRTLCRWIPFDYPIITECTCSC